jgi:hypothetical protein
LTVILMGFANFSASGADSTIRTSPGKAVFSLPPR